MSATPLSWKYYPEKRYDLDNGYVVQYISLGYEFLKFDTTEKKGFEFNFGFSDFKTEEPLFKIKYEGERYENCSEHSTLIFSDHLYDYYIECIDTERMQVIYDDKIYTVNNALEKAIIKISDITKLGYRVVLKEKEAN